jgi:hypothetical protein
MTHTLLVSEIIMNQTYSHSQTPEFDTNKSQTTSVLFQHPKPEEMRVSFWVKTKAVLKEVAAISLIGITVASTVLTVRSCSNDVDHQHAQALKHQLQFSASNEGAR